MIEIRTDSFALRALASTYAVALLAGLGACNPLLDNERRSLFEEGDDASAPHAPPNDAGETLPSDAAEAGEAPDAACAGACTLGATRCASSSTMQTCEATSTCPAWSSPEACHGGGPLGPDVCIRAVNACADPNWAQWPMPPTLTANYTDNQDGTITDNVTQLMWQRYVDATLRSLSDAKAYCAALGANADAGGYNDWRLPSEIELLSLVSYDVVPPVINGTFFPGVKEVGYFFWSSTPEAGTQTGQWSVIFDHGGTRPYDTTGSTNNLQHVRCVR